MSSSLLPFLYQTRTLQRAFRSQPAFARVRFAHSPAKPSRSRRQDNSIPFEWEHDSPYEDLADVSGQQSTITPSEAEVFKSIFDEIAQGQMPSAKKRNIGPLDDATAQSTTPSQSGESGSSMARSIVEQARVTEFRDKFLRRYPQSLRNAAQVALGLYELEPGNSEPSQMMELDEADESKWKERAKYEQARVAERERIGQLMKGCTTDAELWQVMEDEVFSLPARLGIVQNEQGKEMKGKPNKKAKRRSSKQAVTDDSSSSSTQQTADEKRVMDVHGPLYPQFISSGLQLFDTAFARPSPFAFQILPRIKELGLPSYVLGVSTPFYTRLAQMHWHCFGDANSALDVLQEMNSAGLYADEDVYGLLVTIRDHLHGCTWGAQGGFVMGMMESPPYDGTLIQRLEDMEKYAVQSMNEQAGEYSP